MSAALLKAQVALDSASIWFETEAAKSTAIVQAVVEYATRRGSYAPSRRRAAAEDVASKNVSLGDAVALLSAGVDPTSLLKPRALKQLAPTETREAKLLAAVEKKREKAAPAPVKLLKMQSSVADVVYEAKREARERRPGDRVADAFPAIAPKLDDVSRERRRLVSGESVLRALPQKDDAPPAPRAALPRATALPAAAVADAVDDAVDDDAPSAAGSFFDALRGAASELRAYTPEDGERATRELSLIHI